MKKIAIKAALEAGKIIKKGFNNVKEIKFKNNNINDIVTNVDIEAEKKIISIIKNKFPKHNIYSEEKGNLKSASEYLWLIDPIDGTTNFSLGIPCFGTSIALLKNNKTILGIVHNPVTEETYIAERNKGAFLNNKKIKVSSISILNNAFIAVSWWSRDKNYRNKGINTFKKIAQIARKIRSINGTVFDLSKVASGNFDADICDTTFLDIAAAKLIIEEAGGKVTDSRGKDIEADINKIVKIVAANPILHKQILKKMI